MEVHPFIHEILSIKFMKEGSSIKKYLGSWLIFHGYIDS